MRFLPVAVLVAACGAAPRRETSPQQPIPSRDLSTAKPPAPKVQHEPRDPRVVDLDIIRITANPIGTTEDVVASADLFHQATDAAKAGRFDEAHALYRRIVTEFPESQYAPISLFDIAAIADKEGDLEATYATLRELIAKYPQAHESIEGHLYIAALQADHDAYPQAAATLAEVLARPNLTYADRVEAFARRGYIELMQHQLDAADASLQLAIEEARKAPHLDDTYYLAMASYYRGEVTHERFTESPVPAPAPGHDDELVNALDAKRALAVQAYDRWRESLGFQQAYWATAAGYQMSQIFVELWEAHVKAPYPPHIAASARPTYVTEVHARVHEDLAKALEGHRANVELAKAYGVATEWSRASAAETVQITDLLAKEAAGVLVTPSE
jgi:predicted negative regulator of RcsB-dependent stress response